MRRITANPASLAGTLSGGLFLLRGIPFNHMHWRALRILRIWPLPLGCACANIACGHNKCSMQRTTTTTTTKHILAPTLLAPSHSLRRTHGNVRGTHLQPHFLQHALVPLHLLQGALQAHIPRFALLLRYAPLLAHPAARRGTQGATRVSMPTCPTRAAVHRPEQAREYCSRVLLVSVAREYCSCVAKACLHTEAPNNAACGQIEQAPWRSWLLRGGMHEAAEAVTVASRQDSWLWQAGICTKQQSGKAILHPCCTPAGLLAAFLQGLLACRERSLCVRQPLLEPVNLQHASGHAPSLAPRKHEVVRS